MTENRSVVYFARFCQLIVSSCVDGVEIAEDDVIPSFKLHKRIFSDLTNKDVKKGNIGDLLLPDSIQQFLQPQPQPKPQPLNTDPQSTSQRPKSGGRTKHRAFKAVKASKPSSDADLPKTVGTSRIKKRANRPHSDAEPSQIKRRKLVADYLFYEVVQESTPAETPEIVSQDVIENATVPDEARANADEMADLNAEQPELILEMEIEENFEAHPSASVDETEDVAVDQPTVILDESMATHTELCFVTHQVIEKDEEVDQTTKAVLEDDAETAAEPIVDIVESVQENEVENLNSEKMANKDVQETFAENVPNSPSAESSAKSDDKAASSSSPRISVQPNPKVHEFGGSSQHNTKTHFQNMYFANWSSHECIFPNQRAAEFVSKTAATITNPELLAHLKATIVHVKSLNNRFDETQKHVTGLRNDVAARELTLKQEKFSLSRDQEAIRTRLSKLTSVLILDDVKTGERVFKDKCKKSQTLSKKDDTGDGGAKDKEFRSKSIQEQGRLRSNSATAKTNSDRINTAAQSSSKARSLLLTSQPNTDEEIAAQLFLEEHGADATIEDIQAEEKMLAEEHEKNLKSEKIKKVVKVSRPKEKGIIIKENVNSQQSLQYSRRPVEASLDKGKGKLVKEKQVLKKAQSTSDNAQVDKSLEAVTTTDTIQVVQTQLSSSQLQRMFAKPITVQHSLIPGNENILQSRTIMGKESRDRSGLGSHREKRKILILWSLFS
ncbi:hypothetical protein POM88_026879 [Heracleum sosnowskyi]|uniref:Uncharacterized protein n=1 Tax=Heracleum sosnowskyi TaxID=360622 RepID=A0AAD8I7K3_9APIA|nr:hypothetical protein POM88_026879 [Heracleum sosnowskyi]